MYKKVIIALSVGEAIPGTTSELIVRIRCSHHICAPYISPYPTLYPTTLVRAVSCPLPCVYRLANELERALSLETVPVLHAQLAVEHPECLVLGSGRTT